MTLLPRTQAFGYYNHNFVALTERLTDHDERPLPEPRASGSGRSGPAT